MSDVAAKEDRTDKQRRREHTRKEILRAAAEVFTHKGFYEASIQEIAQRAKFSTGSLYNYFDNKEALFHDLLADVAHSFSTHIVTLPKTAPLSERLRELVSSMFVWADEHECHFRLFALLHWSDGLCLGRSIDLENQQRDAQLGRMVALMLDEAIERGELPRQDTDDAATAVVGILHGFASRWFHNPQASRLTARTDAALRLIRNGLMGPEVGPGEVQPRER